MKTSKLYVRIPLKVTFLLLVVMIVALSCSKEDDSTPPGGKPYGNKKPLPKPGTPAARNAPMRDEPLF